MLSLCARSFRSALLFGGVLIVSAAFALFLSASETTAVRVDEDLARYWRTTYDIVVRPHGYRLKVEEDHQLVQPNYLLNIPGGITFDQYEAIRNIPGVEIAAPVAVIGYWKTDVHLRITPPSEGIYELHCIYERSDGISSYWFDNWVYSYAGPDANELIQSMAVNIVPGSICSFPIEGLLVGVDPAAEEALVGLGQALVKGIPLPKVPIPFVQLPSISSISEEFAALLSTPVIPNLSATPQSQRAYSILVPSLTQTQVITAASIPALINVSPFASFTLTAELISVEVPPRVSLDEILQQGGYQYLDTLPRQNAVAAQVTTPSDRVYSQLPQQLPTLPPGTSPAEVYKYLSQLRASGYLGTSLLIPQRCVDYSRTSAPSQGPNLLTLEAKILHCEPLSRPVSPFQIIGVGVLESDRLKHLAEGPATVPVELYFPAIITLLYDDNGNPIKPKALRPSSPGVTPTLDFQPPPLLLTTTEAARAIAGDDCISAIRVRVAGVDRFSPEAQSKIEAVAAEIINRTGLDVDIVVGSSPRPILVHIPGIGYVEEYWVQKGVALTTHREVQRANILLFAGMLAVCTLFIFNTASTTVAGRIPEFGLLKALGWRGSSLAGLVLTEGLLVGGIGGAVGTVLALGVAKALGLVFPLGRAALILPTAVLLCLAGFALPALRAGRVAPVVALRQGEQTMIGRVPRWMGYVGRSLLRRRMRTVLAAGVMAAGAGMLAFLLSLVVGMRGYLALTLLGRYILVRVSGYHWGMVGVMLGVGALATADVLLVGVVERRREIGVLKALGWRTGAVAGLFLLEGAVLGLLGGLAGTALGLGVYLALYRSGGAGLLGAVAAGLGVPAAVGVLAAAYPARVAARVPPAEAMRAE